ncbi:MAG: NAD(P)/FAD-dependent oxidoreductase [Bacteroidota bacterium]
MNHYDITIIGAGVVGLAIARSVSRSGMNILVVERHPSFGNETSCRNSEVIHAGVYYPQDSLKGQLCLKGNDMLYKICRTHNIPFRNSGKLIVANTKEEVALIPALYEKAKNNGAKFVRIVEADEIRKIEPNVRALRAIFCPTSGTVDSHSLMAYFESGAISSGVDILYRNEVIAIDHNEGAYTLTIRQTDSSLYSFTSRIVINAAGLHSEKIAQMLGIDTVKAGYRLVLRKGIYFRAMRRLEHYPRTLIYPLPPDAGAVGIHTTPDLGGGMRLGPYIGPEISEIEYTVDDTLHKYFYDSVKTYLPFLEYDDIQPDSAGILPQLQKPDEPMKDFIIHHESDKGFNNFINLIGIESPGLTASPAIGEYVFEMVRKLIIQN